MLTYLPKPETMRDRALLVTLHVSLLAKLISGLDTKWREFYSPALTCEKTSFKDFANKAFIFILKLSALLCLF